MKRMRSIPLALVVFAVLMACGIEEYAYLEPVTVVDYLNDPLKVAVKLPSDADQTEFFDEYLIYYKIYTTDTASVENTSIDANRDSIKNTNENNPTSLEAVLKSLNFKEISFGNDAENDYSVVENPLSRKVDTNINGQEFTIDFNLNDLGRNYPVLFKEDGTPFKLLRNEELDFSSEMRRQNLTYHSTFETGNGQDYLGTNGLGAAHAMLFIVASGHDSNFSQLHSTAMEIGVFPLEDKD